MTKVRFIFGLLIAAFLIWLLFQFGELEFGAVSARISQIGWWWFPIVVAAFAQVAISAEKWRRVLLATEQESNFGFGFCLFYSSLAAVLSQFLTVYAASIAVRSIAAKARNKIGLGRGAIIAGIEQVFDAIVLAVVVLPTVVALTFSTGLGVWLSIFVTIMLITIYLVGNAGRILKKARQDRIPAILRGPAANEVFRSWFALALTWLSLLRYATMFFRVFLISVASGFAISLSDLFLGFNTAQISQLFSITPGNLGIFEWSWSGVLAYRGTPVEIAIQLAFVIRIATFFCYLALLPLAAIYFWYEDRQLRSRLRG